MGFFEVEQRGAERIVVVAPCEIEVGGRCYHAELSDISLSGCRAKIHQYRSSSAKAGDDSTISFVLADNSRLNIPGKVVRTEFLEPSFNPIENQHLTFQFLNLDQPRQDALKKIFSTWMAAWSAY